MSYIVIAIVSFIVLGALYFRKKKSTDVIFTQLIKKPLSDISNKEKKQNQENCKYIAELINGHYSHHVSNQAKKKSIKKFEKWQEKMNFLFAIADPEKTALRDVYIKEKTLHIFKFTYMQQSPCLAQKKRPEGWQLFCKNGFTEPFPSFHDMDDWAVITKLTDFFILNDITPEEARRFVFHEKRHYVNHEMERAIIQFDLYRVPA